MHDTCSRGHALTPDNLVHDAGWRRCLTCKREYNRAYMRRRRAAYKASAA